MGTESSAKEEMLNRAVAQFGVCIVTEEGPGSPRKAKGFFSKQKY